MKKEPIYDTTQALVGGVVVGVLGYLYLRNAQAVNAEVKSLVNNKPAITTVPNGVDKGVVPPNSQMKPATDIFPLSVLVNMKAPPTGYVKHIQTTEGNGVHTDSQYNVINSDGTKRLSPQGYPYSFIAPNAIVWNGYWYIDSGEEMMLTASLLSEQQGGLAPKP